MKRFYTEVSENKLLVVPTMDTVRIDLLERARKFYERIAQERPDDSNVQAELARTIWRLAVMVGGSRSVPEGIGLMEQTIAIQERLVHEYPGRPEYRSDLARSFNNLGIMHRSNKQLALGAEDWKRSLALREQLVREKPEDFLSRRDLAQSLQNLGNSYRGAGGHDSQVEEFYRRALTIQTALALEAPDAAQARTDRPFTPFALDPARIRYDLAFTYSNLGGFYVDSGQTAKARSPEASDRAPGPAGSRATRPRRLPTASVGDALRARPSRSIGWPAHPDGHSMESVPRTSGGARPRTSGGLELPIRPGHDAQEPEHRRRRDRPAGKGGRDPPVGAGKRGAVDSRASRVECLFLRRGTDLHELWDVALPECQQLGRPKHVRRIMQRTCSRNARGI